ncbi:MAG: tRNA (adenosine(37)-N6)-threonylcarbamoyltransferase complex transferase subunit TsaD [Clostridiales bacterium]|jgi:N6-L-threonylcarbamoyladenine synthase|nr:tRNA (adenosine(37)-N6)-threonylcarbamoyltransferase complex transferase subunit TsaD [Clostridiales bacterium]
MIKDIVILAIETSCDETAAAIIKNGRVILSNIVASQIDTHKKFGGVIPEIASRKHIEIISQIIDKSLFKANLKFMDIDAIAVTQGPGLVSALLIGTNYAKNLAYALKKKIIAVNHVEGHICANYLENNFEPKFICAVISGGHTSLFYVKDYNSFEILGETLDDAAGEAYDKIARVLDLGYPGGPAIDKISKDADKNFIEFKIPIENSLDFSFSGLKSSVTNFVYKQKNIDFSFKKNVAASFQECVTNSIVKKIFKACELKKINKIAISGGVASNSCLRKKIIIECQKRNFEFNIPDVKFCTDNAAMIASRAFYKYINNEFYENLDLNAKARI